MTATAMYFYLAPTVPAMIVQPFTTVPAAMMPGIILAAMAAAVAVPVIVAAVPTVVTIPVIFSTMTAAVQMAVVLESSNFTFAAATSAMTRTTLFRPGFAAGNDGQQCRCQQDQPDLIHIHPLARNGRHRDMTILVNYSRFWIKTNAPSEDPIAPWSRLAYALMYSAFHFL